MTATLRIDGSHGEGGGQILRTALSLAAVTGTPFELHSIRAGRPRPGMAAQHLTAVRATAEICGAQVTGDELRSETLLFVPGQVNSGNYLFDVARIQPSAGAISLIAPPLLPPLLFAPGDSTLTLRGGTHVPFSPPFQYLTEVLLPTIAAMGGNASAVLRRAGWYPKGGGEFGINMTATSGLTAFTATETGPWTWRGLSAVSNLPDHILRRQAEGANELLHRHSIDAEFEFATWPTLDCGTVCFLHGRTGMARAGFTALGKRGKPAERVGAEAAQMLVNHAASGCALDPHLADQILIYLALAEGRSAFSTSCISRHLLTNVWVIEQFLPVRFTVGGEEGEPGLVTVDGVGR